MKFGATESTRLTRFIVVLIGIAIAATPLCFLLWAAFRSHPRTTASAIPEEQPSEAYRVFHPSDFSIVRPLYWESRLAWDINNTNVGGIELLSPVGQKPDARLVIAKLAEEPKLRGPIRAIQFQGQPARMTVERRAAEMMEHPGQLTVEIAFQRDGSWWLLRYFLFREQEMVPDMMWKYFETFSPRPPNEPVRPSRPA